MVHGVGVNDMERGWRKVNNWNYRVYNVWQSMIQRCYSKKYHEKQPTYIGCVVCERWLFLSNFVEDVTKIDNYDYWLNHPNERVALDKDIKSDGTNKCYCLENCCFTTIEENAKQSNKTRDYDNMKGEKNPMYGVHRYGEKAPCTRKVVSLDPLTKQTVFIWQYKKQATEFYNISNKTLDYYLKGKAKSGHLYNGFLWYYVDTWEQLNK